MALNREYADYVEDLLQDLGGVRVRPMFSGGGVFCGDLMFALISDDTLYFKADEQTAPDFAAEGSEPFTYSGKGRTVSLGYWRAPERLSDDQDEMLAWAREALGTARRNAGKGGRRKPAKGK